MVAVAPDSPQALAADMRVEPLELELSPTLVDLVDAAKGGDLLDRVKGLRRKLATERGLIIPPVRTRDNVHLDNDSYAIRLHGVEVAKGTAPAGRFLAIGGGLDLVPGDAGRGARVRAPGQVGPGRAAPAGPRGRRDRHRPVVGHHHPPGRGGQPPRRPAALRPAGARRCSTRSRVTDPAVIEEMGAAQVSLTDLHRVLCGLLAEGVAIRDLVRIVEAVTEQARQAKEPEALLEAARRALGPAITAAYAKDGTLPIISLDARFERQLADAVRPGDGGTVLAIEPDVVEALVREVGAIARQAEEHNRDAVLVCASRLRPSLRRLLAPALPRLGVLSVNELGPQVKLDRIGVVNVTPAEVV